MDEEVQLRDQEEGRKKERREDLARGCTRREEDQGGGRAKDRAWTEVQGGKRNKEKAGARAGANKEGE